MFCYRRPIVVVTALLALLLVSGTARAHERREVGPYLFVVGFLNEPAFAGEQNAMSVRISDAKTEEPAEGLEEHLSAQLIYGAEQRDMQLTPVWNDPGHYKAHFYPTAAGDYTFRFVGEIGGTPVDETFTSKPGGFNAVQDPVELQFPVHVPTAIDLNAQLLAAHSTARTATILGGAGLALGLVSLITALLALRGRRSTSAVQEPSAAGSAR
jgi:hypothetical protein